MPMLIVQVTASESPLFTTIPVNVLCAKIPLVDAVVPLNNPASEIVVGPAVAVNVLAIDITDAPVPEPAPPVELVKLTVPDAIVRPAVAVSACRATSLLVSVVLPVPSAMNENGTVSAPTHVDPEVTPPALYLAGANNAFAAQSSPFLVMTLSLCLYAFRFPSLSRNSSVNCPDTKADEAKEVAGLTTSDVEEAYPTRPALTATIATSAIVNNLFVMCMIQHRTSYI